MPLITEDFQFTPLPSSSSHHLQPPSQPSSRPSSPNQGKDTIPDSFLPADVGDLLSGLGADDLDDFGDIDDEDIGNDRSFEEAHPSRPEFEDGFGGGSEHVEIPKMVGFATAGGKKLKSPSREAIAKAKQMWAGEEEDNFEDENKPAKKPRLSDPEEYQSPFDEPAIDFPVNHIGFKTGKGKDMAPPRAESLQRASKLFNEIDQAMEEEPSSSMPSSSFQHSTSVPRLGTSSSRPTHIKPLAPPSLQSMQRAAQLFQDINQEDSYQPSPIASGPSQPQTSGFTLASGGAAPRISESAMAKAMSILDGDDTPSKPSFQSPSAFRSASSKTALNHPASPQFERHNGEEENQSQIPSSSFKSASGKDAAPLSNASRATVAHLFNDLDTNMATPIRPRPQAPAQPPARGNSPISTPFMRQRSTQLFAQPATPLRTPVGNSSASLPSNKRPIQIKTPSGPIRRIGLGSSTPSQRPFKRGFSTPFKTTSGSTPFTPAAVRAPGPFTQRQINHYRSVFDLEPPPQRQDYKSAFLHPQYYSIDELREINIPDDLSAINLENASLYNFLAEDDAFLGHQDALRSLQSDGCNFAKANWVENHWAQILWKLAGQVQARPELFQEKWNWNEVINQLKYRYEREYGSAERSIIKRIQEHDSSPSLPMVLVVSGIHHAQVEGKPKYSLELTDGWYRIKAQIDESIQRAVTKGRIAVGRKMAISGAKLESGNDGQDVLEAFSSSHLIISGNSSSLAKWHVKLGKQPQPFIASLSSLSVDGGVITLVDVVLEKIFPVAFTNKNEAPWGEEEEQARQQDWMNRYEGERTRLSEKMRKEMEKMEDLAALLAQSAEESDPVNHEPPDSLEYDYDTLLEAKDAMSCLRSMSTYQIVHLAGYANMRIGQELQDKQVEMEAELATLCPKRDVRDFRMIRLVDAQTGNRDSFRVGMLNVWDVKALGEGVLQEGKRYLISNVVPGKGGDWNIHRTRSDRAEVYLHTRRDTRWQPVE